MIDGEKIIKALELCTTPVAPSECEGSCLKCGYMNEAKGNKLICIPILLKDVLSMLNEQQKLIDEITQRRMDNGAFD